MTARVRSLTVVLEGDIREDDVEPLVQAIAQLRGVAAVTAEVVESADYSARERLAYEWRATMLQVFGALAAGRKVTIEDVPPR